MSGWWGYVERVTQRAQQKDIAEATGIEQSSISRWKLGKNPPKAESVVTLARAYHRPPVEALIAAGYLQVDEVSGVIEVADSVQDLATEDLMELQAEIVDEIRRRYKTLRGNPERGRRQSDGAKKRTGPRIRPDAPTV